MSSPPTFPYLSSQSRYYAPAVYRGIKRYRDPSVYLSVCLSHGTAAVGAQLP